jgi:hypothetical protein
VNLAAFQEFVKLLVALTMRERIDFIEAFISLFLKRCISRDPGRHNVARVKVTVADDLDGIDPGDFLFDKFEYRRTKIPGDAPVCFCARQPVFQETWLRRQERELNRLSID